MRNPPRDDAYRLLEAHGLAQTERYLRQGRRFAQLTVVELVEQFVSAYREAAVQPEKWPSEEANDITAEFELRGIEPPHDQVMAEMTIIEAHMKETYLSASKEQLDWIGAALEAELAALKQRMN